MSETPAALQLRLLQTIVEVAAEKNSTLVLPFPVELLRFLEHAGGGSPTAAVDAVRKTVAALNADAPEVMEPASEKIAIEGGEAEEAAPPMGEPDEEEPDIDDMTPADAIARPLGEPLTEPPHWREPSDT
jgi:hypothetical protein